MYLVVVYRYVRRETIEISNKISSILFYEFCKMFIISCLINLLYVFEKLYFFP